MVLTLANWLLSKELDEKNEALLEKYERYEYLSEFDS